MNESLSDIAERFGATVDYDYDTHHDYCEAVETVLFGKPVTIVISSVWDTGRSIVEFDLELYAGRIEAHENADASHSVRIHPRGRDERSYEEVFRTGLVALAAKMLAPTITEIGDRSRSLEDGIGNLSDAAQGGRADDGFFEFRGEQIDHPDPSE